MKLLNCPLNGPRNISEFVYGGEYHAFQNPAAFNSTEWANELYMQANSADNVVEWWCHSASAYWFLAERNTVSDEVLRTFPASDLCTRKQLVTSQGVDP